MDYRFNTEIVKKGLFRTTYHLDKLTVVFWKNEYDQLSKLPQEMRDDQIGGGVSLDSLLVSFKEEEPVSMHCKTEEEAKEYIAEITPGLEKLKELCSRMK